jgi:hypothetical protein
MVVEARSIYLSAGSREKSMAPAARETRQRCSAKDAMVTQALSLCQVRPADRPNPLEPSFYMPLEPLWGDKTQTHTGETTWTNRTSCMAFSCTSCTRKLPSHSWTESTTVSFIAVSMATQVRYSELSSSVFNNFCRTATSDRTNPYDAKDGTDNRFIWS